MLARQKEPKEQKCGFLSMLLGTLGANLLENMLAGKGAIATSASKGTIRAPERTTGTGQDF